MICGTSVRGTAGASPGVDTVDSVEAADLAQTAARHPRGDRDAFSAAVADHHRELARFAYRLCGDRTVAEDIVAEAYARVWPHWRRGRVEVLLPYLMRTVANQAYARHRRL